jgi:hypothetical protein
MLVQDELFSLESLKDWVYWSVLNWKLAHFVKSGLILMLVQGELFSLESLKDWVC